MDPITIPKAPNVFLEKCSNTGKQPIKAYLLVKKTRFLVKVAGFFSEMVFVANKRCAFLKSQKSLLIRVKDF
jgi:hypothetical protein